MQLYSKAELLMFQNRIEEAVEILDSITVLFPYHNLSDDVLFARSKILVKQRNFEKAAEYLQAIITTYGDDLLGDDATFMLAELYERQLNNREKAMDLYKNLLMTYRDSVLIVEARKRFRALRGDGT